MNISGRADWFWTGFGGSGRRLLAAAYRASRGISEIADRRIRDVRDELKEGQQIMVKCIGKEGNKIKLSRKAVLHDENPNAEAATNQD